MRRGLIIVCLAFLSVTSAYGRQTEKPKGQADSFISDSWDMESGLPQNSVWGIVQSKDGFLWLGTEEGLARFDGRSFLVFDPSNSPLPSKIVRTLLASVDGTLWIGTANELVAIRGKEFTVCSVKDGLPRAQVNTLMIDRNGSLWVGTTRGLFVRNGVSFEPVGHSSGFAMSIFALMEDRFGDIWVGTNKGLGKIRNKQVIQTPDKFGSGTRITALGQDSLGILIGTIDGALIRLGKNKTIVYRYKGKKLSAITSIGYLGEDNLLIGTRGEGLFLFSGGGLSQFTAQPSLSSNFVASTFIDKDAFIWVGTVGGGLTRIKKRVFFAYGKTEGLSEDNVTAVFQDRDGKIWIGTQSRGVEQFSRDFQRIRHSPPQFVGTWVRTIFQDREGAVWVGTLGGGLGRFTNSGFDHYGIPDGLATGWISSIGEDFHGNLIVGQYGGPALVYRDRHFSPLRIDNNPLPGAVKSLHQGSSALWVVTFDNRLIALRQSKITQYDSSSGFPQPDVLSLYEDPFGTMWIGTAGGGLWRMKNGSFTQITTRQGLADNSVFVTLLDGSGRIWMSSNKGVFTASLDELNAVMDGRNPIVRCTTFGTADGMRTRECNGGNQSSGFRDMDGKLWFSTAKGLVAVDPNSVDFTNESAAVLLDNVLIDGERQDPLESLLVPPGKRDLELHYTALSYYDPDHVEFKYKLEGYDREWINAGNRRAAYYTNLPPGNYTFHVIAASGHGIWNTTSVRKELIVKPTFYQTTWFLLLSVVVIGLVGAGIHKLQRTYRDRGLIASQLRSQLALSQLNVLKSQLRPHFLFNTLNTVMVYVKENPDIAYATLGRLSDLLRAALKDLERQEVPLLRELKLLKSYVEIEKVRFEDRLSVKIRVDEDVKQALIPTFILQPLVENAITHGFKDTLGRWIVEITAKRKNGMVEIVVSDNGVGFSSVEKEEGNGIGLSNAIARMQFLYGNGFTLERFNKPSRGGAFVMLRYPFRTKEGEHEGNG